MSADLLGQRRQLATGLQPAGGDEITHQDFGLSRIAGVGQITS